MLKILKWSQKCSTFSLSMKEASSLEENERM